MDAFLGWLMLIGIVVVVFRYPHWFRRHVLYKQKHLASIEARRPFCVATKQLSEKALYDLIKEKLPDTHTDKGSIRLVPATGNLPTTDKQLHFAILSSRWAVGKTGYIKTGNGNVQQSSIRFTVIVGRKQDETVATLKTLTWTERKGIFNTYVDLTRAQDTLLKLVQDVDPQATAFTE